MNNNTNVYSLLPLMVAIAAVSVVVGGGAGLVATFNWTIREWRLPSFD
jgi:hypothetical protein